MSGFVTALQYFIPLVFGDSGGPFALDHGKVSKIRLFFLFGEYFIIRIGNKP
jgi:hypothetical protein